jgi:dTDP-4-amino-4,6-dideoxygalactose transaminase
VGGNFRLDAIQAAVLRAKLRHLDFWIEARRRNAAQYRQLFADAAFASAIVPQADALLVLPFEVPGSRHVYNQFVVLARRRDELRSFLAQQGIASEIYYRAPLHLQTPFASDRYAKGDFPRAERASDRALSLPMYAELCAADQEAIVREVVRFYS